MDFRLHQYLLKELIHYLQNNKNKDYIVLCLINYKLFQYLLLRQFLE